jgi:hypothetical protein
LIFERKIQKQKKIETYTNEINEMNHLIDELMYNRVRLEELRQKVALYEQNGAAKLFYALNRKANEMADLLNKTNLSHLLLEDPKDKTFERLKAIWNDSSALSTAIKDLGISAGVTGDEQKDVVKKPFVESIAESRR